ncbi:MAG: glycosyltransferase [Muribaculum sp.]|nr:glycosyltransferase [Muribaculum sp.]
MDNPTEKSMNTPLISVIVPVYNIMEYLPRCVQSVRNQTYEKLEILLVDDGSTDGTGALCDKLAARDSRIRVFHKENGGSSSARNLGLEQAKGEYIGFVDSDDYIDEDMYERLLKAILGYQGTESVKVAQIGRDEIDERGNRLPDICVPPKTEELISHRDFLKELLMHRGDCSFCTKLFHKSVLEGRQFPVGALNEDFHFLVQMLPEIGNILSLPEQTYHVFYRMGSNSRKTDREQFSRVYADSVTNADMVMQMVDVNDRELIRIARRFGVFQRLEYMLHIPISQMKKENKFYMRVVRDLRKGLFQGLTNPYLTAKNKIYMLLFATAPKTVRKLHKKLRTPK